MGDRDNPNFLIAEAVTGPESRPLPPQSPTQRSTSLQLCEQPENDAAAEYGETSNYREWSLQKCFTFDFGTDSSVARLLD